MCFNSSRVTIDAQKMTYLCSFTLLSILANKGKGENKKTPFDKGDLPMSVCYAPKESNGPATLIHFAHSSVIP